MNDVGLDVVRFIHKRMEIDPEWTVWHPRGFTWWGHRLAQHIWAEPCIDDQGIILSRVHARTDLLDGFTGSDDQYVQLMRLRPVLTSLSGPIRDPRDSARVQTAASVWVHAETKDCLGAVLAQAAIIQGDWADKEVEQLAKAVKARPAYSAHPKSGTRKQRDEILDVPSQLLIPMGQAPSRFQGQEMLDALNWLQRPPCVLATGNEAGFCAEFPFGSFTSMLQASTDISHLVLGKGLHMVLQLPEGPSGLDNPEAARMALELNEREQQPPPFAHFLGSWCPAPTLCFLSFYPNSLFVPGWTTTLVQKAMGRAHWAAVDVFQAGWNFGQACKLKQLSLSLFEEEPASSQPAERAVHLRNISEPRSTSPDNSRIRFRCQHCGKLLKAPFEKAGYTCSCVYCGKSVQVPSLKATLGLQAGKQPQSVHRQPLVGSRRSPSESLKELVNRLDTEARRSLEAAAGLAVSHGHHYLQIEHWLLKLLEKPGSDFMNLLHYYEIITKTFTKDLSKALEKLPKGNQKPPGMAPELVNLLEWSGAFASKVFNSFQIRPDHVIYALRADRALAAQIRQVTRELDKIPVDSLRDRLMGAPEEGNLSQSED